MERRLLLLKILPQASVPSNFHVQLVTCFSYQTNSNYSTVQGKDSDKVFWVNATRTFIVFLRQCVAGHCYANSLYELCRNPDFIFVKDYHCEK